MKPRLYLETTIISYLAGRPSRDIVTLGRQQLTIAWWAFRRNRFDLTVSEAVRAEIGMGDPGAAARRLKLLEGIPILALTEEVDILAKALHEAARLPDRVAADAVHTAASVAKPGTRLR